MDLNAQCKSIKLLLSDVDGVLTDGKLIYGGTDVELKEFHVRDGLAVKLWRSCGHRFGFVTARCSKAVQRRADELEVDFVVQGRADKLAAVGEIADQLDIGLEAICYIGDDLQDLAAIQGVGFGATVANAAPEVLENADFVTTANGGIGAVRELIELILKAQDKWSAIIELFLHPEISANLANPQQ